MPYIFGVLVFILFLVILSMLNERNLAKRRIASLKREWGAIPEEEYTSEKFQSIQAYYQTIKNDKVDVDDITWNDLDMDEIYMLMNNTQSAIGEEYLYALLRKPFFSSEELVERNRVIKFFQERENSRINLQSELYKVGKLSQISIYEYINLLDKQDTKSNIPHYLMILGLLLSVILIFIQPAWGGIGTVIFVANNIYRYYKRKAKIEHYLTVFSFIVRLLNSIKGIMKFNIPELKVYMDTLKADTELFKKFQKGSMLLTAQNPSGDIADVIFDYVRMLFHVDIIKYNSMLSFLKRNRKTLNRIYTTVGYLDSMMAAASFRTLIKNYSEPELTKTNRPGLKVVELYHPLIENPVVNSISENRCVLITGSNASGKSTFIKTLAINAILSQTIYTSLAKSYKASFFIISSSMALRDSIFRNESYYIVEIKSLKRILDRVNKDIPMLCFIDEVLRGTNTQERIAASSRILHSLSNKNTMVFAATHDIELTHILEDFYSNYHFQERIIDDQIIFDYKLYPGRAVSKNAIKLLGLLGYTKDIINAAEKAAEEFQTKGEWSKIIWK